MSVPEGDIREARLVRGRRRHRVPVPIRRDREDLRSWGRRVDPRHKGVPQLAAGRIEAYGVAHSWEPAEVERERGVHRPLGGIHGLLRAPDARRLADVVGIVHWWI